MLPQQTTNHYFKRSERSRVKHHISEDEKESLELRSQTLLDILTLKTFNEAFDDCRDDIGHPDLRMSHYPSISSYDILIVPPPR